MLDGGVEFVQSRKVLLLIDGTGGIRGVEWVEWVEWIGGGLGGGLVNEQVLAQVLHLDELTKQVQDLFPLPQEQVLVFVLGELVGDGGEFGVVGREALDDGFCVFDDGFEPQLDRFRTFVQHALVHDETLALRQKLVFDLHCQLLLSGRETSRRLQ